MLVTIGEARFKVKENKYMRTTAATFGIELQKADDANKVVQQIQKMELPYYLRLDGTRVKCVRREAHLSLNKAVV